MGEKLLVALDGSEHSWTTFNYAIQLAKRFGLDMITAVHSEVGEGKTELEEYEGRIYLRKPKKEVRKKE